MNFFIRNRVLIWILAGLLIITLSILGSLIYHTWTEPEKVVLQSGCSSSCKMLFSELELDSGQQAEMDQILDHFRDSSTNLVVEMRHLRLLLLDELQKEVPDTLQISALSKELGDIQTRMIRITAKQYLQIRSICNPDQQQQLSNVYCDLFGCPRVEKNQEQKQGQHHYRHGKTWE